MGLVLVILSYLVTKFILPFIKSLLINAGAVRKNYLNHDIPIGLGMVFLFGTLPSFFLFGFLFNEERLLVTLLVLTITLLVGFIDDLLGNHSVKGIKGHFLRLIKDKELTSGALKAIVISTVSFFAVIYYWESSLQFVLNFFILILTTNTFNLLDARPGRTIKAYLLASILILIFFPQNSIMLVFIMASVLAYAPLDLKGKGMLGDAGSNFLGISLGLELMFKLSVSGKIFITLFLVVLHIYTEKKSLTELIEKISFLKLIDNLGR